MFRHRYFKELSKAENHVRYIAYRDREGVEKGEERYGLFSEFEDNVDVKTFIKSLDDKMTSHYKSPTLHTFLFSMSGDEWERSGFEPEDFREMVRDVMKDYETQTGKKLEWVAAEHLVKGHPHVHVAIKGVYKDRDGVEHLLKISRKDGDHAIIRNSFREAKNHTRGFDLPARDFQQRLRNREIREKSRSASSFIDALFYEIEKDLREKERQAEYERGR